MFFFVIHIILGFHVVDRDWILFFVEVLLLAFLILGQDV